MALPGNGIFVVQGEMAMLVTAMRRSTRWGSHTFLNEEFDVLMRTFQELKTILNQVDDLRLIDPLTYLSPFLEVIRSKETTGPVTSIALSAINKFLSYGLIDPTHPSVPATVEDIADAVTHARFVGTDHSSDGVVLMKILQVLRTLMLSPEGAMLTDESVCEIMLSCFRICFETRLTELLRRHAEQCLRDMTQLIFMRLPQFPPEDGSAPTPTAPLSLKKRDRVAKKKTSGGNSTGSLERGSTAVEKSSTVTDSEESQRNEFLKRHSQDKNLLNEAEITIELDSSPRSGPKKHGRHSSMELSDANVNQLLKCVSTGPDNTDIVAETTEQKVPEEISQTEPTTRPSDENKESSEVTATEIPPSDNVKTDSNEPDNEAEDTAEKLEEYVNHRGIRFTPQNEAVNLQPYGLVCVRELFRFLISLCHPLDSQNTSAMVQLGLSLAGVALEVASDHLHNYPSLMGLLKDQMCFNLISLLSTERISIFALDLQVSYLLFESLRHHLKYQMEAFFKKIIEIISTDTTKAIYELKEIHHLALEYLSQMFRIPGLCTELYLNYDCDVYCINVFEELTKLLSQNVVSSTAYNVHTLSLEALMTIIEAIEGGNAPAKTEASNSDPTFPEDNPSEVKFGRPGHVSLELGGLECSSVSSEPTHISQYVCTRGTKGLQPNDHQLLSNKKIKQWITKGVEQFNSHPERGIEYLQRHGVLSTEPSEVAMFLRQCPHLDNKMIGEYICKRSSRGCDDESGTTASTSILSAFANSFHFAGLRIDKALRLYLETFRLPGEAPLIFLLMEKFAERWHTENGSPFANTDAAFRLAYAIIMLNMDQHNHNAKKLNVPMTVEDFVKNLRGCNGSGDFDQQLLESIFYAIKNEEMIMPAERSGPVKEAYLWRVLQRRGASPSAAYLTTTSKAYAPMLVQVAGLPTVTALSSAFERAPNPSQDDIDSPRDCPAIYALKGLERCAALTVLTNNLGNEETEANDRLTIDTLILTLCKFTGLSVHNNYIAIGVTLGQNTKSQLALESGCGILSRLGHAARAAWSHLLLNVHTLFVGRLLPTCMIEVEDYLSPNNTVSLIREVSRGTDAGLLSSLYSYIALGETGLRAPTPHENTLIESARACVARCNLPALLVDDTKFLPMDSLHELVRAMISVGAPPDSESLQMNPELEDITIFFLELLGKTLIQNRDRVKSLWSDASSHITSVVLWSASRAARDPRAFVRCCTALLRNTARLMRSEHCAAEVLHSLAVLHELPYRLIHAHSDIITCGLYEIVKTSAQNVHSAEEWRLLLSLLCVAGAGAVPQTQPTRSNAASSRSEGSSDESERRATSAGSDAEPPRSPRPHGWIMVNSEPSSSLETLDTDLEDLYTGHKVTFRPVRSSSVARCVETLSLVVRDMSHVAPHNCRYVVRALRLAAYPMLQTGKKPGSRPVRHKRPNSRRNDESSGEEDNTLDQYHMASIQLLDLMHTLHSRTAQIFKWWRDESDQGQGEDYDLWEVAWMPLLQGIALFCTDRRKQVSNSGLAYLQRALLAPGLAGAGGAAWGAAFSRVLFPLLRAQPTHPARANTLLCKVFLHHLSALSGLPTFPSLWARLLSCSGALISAGPEPLAEAATESLKNVLLVMHSVKIFNNGDGYSDLWYMTWEKINEFLPNLKNELFPEEKDTKSTNVPSHMQPPIPSTFPAIVPVSQPPGNVQVVPTQAQNIPTLAQNMPTLTQNMPTLAQNMPMVQNTGNNPDLHGTGQYINIPHDHSGYFVSENQQDLSKLPPTAPQLPTNFAQSVPTVPMQIPHGVNIMQGYNNQILTQSPPNLGQSPPNYAQIPVHLGLQTLEQNPQNASTIGQPQNIGQSPASLGENFTLSTEMSQKMGLNRIILSSPPTLVSQTPPNLIAPTPVSGMVPIRNPLYSQGGLTSSILLQPLNEMVSTSIGVSSPQMPIICPTSEPTAINQNQPHPQVIETNLPNTILDMQDNLIAPKDVVEQSEIFSDYLNNPYNETKDLSAKEATLYEPKSDITDQTVPLRNPQLSKLEQKSHSENSSPMHNANKGQFSSTDNLRSEGSGIFNFASYFGSGADFSTNSEVFDNLMTPSDG